MKTICESKYQTGKKEAGIMNVAQLADQLRRDNHFMKDVTRWEVIPARPANPLRKSLRRNNNQQER